MRGHNNARAVRSASQTSSKRSLGRCARGRKGDTSWSSSREEVKEKEEEEEVVAGRGGRRGRAEPWNEGEGEDGDEDERGKEL